MAASSGRSSRRWKEVIRPRVLRNAIDNAIPCPGCGLDFTEEDLLRTKEDPFSMEADHIVPLSHLGPNDPRREALSNLRAMHKHCNARRGDAAVGPENPTGGEW